VSRVSIILTKNVSLTLCLQVSLLELFFKYYNHAKAVLLDNMAEIMEKHEMDYDESSTELLIQFLNWSSPQAIYYGNLLILIYVLPMMVQSKLTFDS